MSISYYSSTFLRSTLVAVTDHLMCFKVNLLQAVQMPAASVAPGTAQSCLQWGVCAQTQTVR